jgi:hypothetical protein
MFFYIKEHLRESNWLLREPQSEDVKPRGAKSSKKFSTKKYMNSQPREFFQEFCSSMFYFLGLGLLRKLIRPSMMFLGIKET